jgi:hypothetical protein
MRDINDIKTGDVILVRTNSWIGKQIQFFETSRYNHASRALWLNKELFVIEAGDNGICLTPFKNYLTNKYELLILRPRYKTDENEFINFVLPFAGHYGYGYANLLFFQPIKFTFKTWIGGKNPKRFICGQFVMFTINHFNKELYPHWWDGSPDDIYNDEENYIIYVFEK